METDQIFLSFEDRLRDFRALLDAPQGFLILGGAGSNGTVIQAIEGGNGGGNSGDNTFLLQALAHDAGDKFREEDRGIGGMEEGFNGIRANALDMDIEALQLSLESVQALHRGSPVIFTGVQLLQD